MNVRMLGAMVFASGLFGVTCTAMSWQEWQIYSTGSPTPADVSLDALTTNGAGGNVHVHVTEVQFSPAYVVQLKDHQWYRALVPVLSAGRVRAVVRTHEGTDPAQLGNLCSRPDVTGIVTNNLYSLEPEYVLTLQTSHPGVDFYSLPVIEEGRTFPTNKQLWLLTGAAAGFVTLTAVTGLLWAVRIWREMRQAGPDRALAYPVFPGTQGFGMLRRTFPTGPVSKNMIGGGVFLPFFFASAVAFDLAVSMTEQLYLYCAAGLVGAMTGFLVLVGRAHLGDSAALYDDGLVSRRRGKTMTCRWDEVESATGMLRVQPKFVPVYAGGPLLLRTVYRATIRFGDVKDPGDLADAVYREVLQRQLPQALASIRQGDDVWIEPLALARSGITTRDGRSLDWTDVQEVAIAKDLLVVRKTGERAPWWTGSLATPNAALLLELAAAVRRGEIG
jgi:hypothetical protein